MNDIVRDYFFAAHGNERMEDVRIEISYPRFGADPGMPSSACSHIKISGPLPREGPVFGVDEMQAIALAIYEVVTHLKQMQERGNFQDKEGEAADIDEEFGFFVPFLDFAQKWAKFDESSGDD